MDDEGTGCTAYEAQPTGIVGIAGEGDLPERENIMNKSDFSVFSVKPCTFMFHGSPYTYQAIAVNGLIAWDVWADGSRAPIFWARKQEELQDMIDEGNKGLLGLLRDEVVKDEIVVCGQSC